MSSQAVSADGNTIRGEGYANDNLLRSVSNAPIKNAGDVWAEYRYAAIFGRAILATGRINSILNISARRDEVPSRFGLAVRLEILPAAGAARTFLQKKLV